MIVGLQTGRFWGVRNVSLCDYAAQLGTEIVDCTWSHINITHDCTWSHIITHYCTPSHIITHNHTSSHIITHHRTSSHIIAHRQFEEVKIFRDTQTNRHFIIIYIYHQHVKDLKAGVKEKRGGEKKGKWKARSGESNCNRARYLKIFEFIWTYEL